MKCLFSCFPPCQLHCLQHLPSLGVDAQHVMPHAVGGVHTGMRTMAARLLSRSAPSTKPKGDGGTSGVMFGDVTPCRVACAQVSATQLQSIAPGEGARREGVLVYKLCHSVQRTSTAGHKSKPWAAWARGTRPLL